VTPNRNRTALLSIFAALVLLLCAAPALARTTAPDDKAKVRAHKAALAKKKAAAAKRAAVARRALAGSVIVNGSFEDSLAGWVGYGSTISRVAGGAVGSYSARVTQSGSASGGFSIIPTSVHVTSSAAGATYTGSAFVKTSRPDLTVCLRIRAYAGSKEIGYQTTCLNGAATWTAFGALIYKPDIAGRRLDIYAYAWDVRRGDSFQVDGIALGVVGPTPPANVAPAARLSFAPAAPTSGSAVSFDGSTSSDADGSVVSHAWSFGDGGSAAGAQPSHTFTQPGAYAVSLTVTDDKGATGTTSTSVVVAAPPPPPPPPPANVPPTARLSFAPTAPTTGTATTFDGSASSDPDGSVTSYAWSFADGATASGAQPSHSYSLAGTYLVSLTVTDDKGATDSATVSVTVAAPPPPPPPPPPVSGVSAVAVDNAHILLTWGAVTGAARYRVSRDGAVLGTTAASTFTDALLWPSTQYTYSVAALNASGGTLTTQNAAAATTPLPAAGFARPFPASSVWNSPVGSTPLRPESATFASYLAARAGSANMPISNWAVAVAEAHPGDKTFTVPCLKYTCTLSAFGAFAIPETAKQDPSGDGHLAVYDPATQREWDMWQASNSSGSWASSAGAAVSMTGNGVAPVGFASGNAANFPLLGGLIRPEEILQGRIDHALVFGMPGVNNTGYVCPATHNDGDTTSSSAPKEGTRFQLDPSLNIDALAVPAWKKTMMRAMQTYGLYLRDSSGSFAVYAENPVSRGYDAWAKVGLAGGSVSLSGIPWDKLRAVASPC
jgi:PKD repeat protein